MRPAEMDDVDQVTTMVALAFASDDAWAFMMGEGNTRAMKAFATALLVPRIRRRTAWVTDDLTALAMWDRRAIGLARDPDHEERWGEFRSSVGDAIAARVDAYDAAVESAGPSCPYWYLGVLATHPEARGRGLATAVLQPGFAGAQADGWDCWLETSAPGNKSFYAGRGFSDGHPFEVPGGPTTWWLRRPHGAGHRALAASGSGP